MLYRRHIVAGFVDMIGSRGGSRPWFFLARFVLLLALTFVGHEAHAQSTSNMYFLPDMFSIDRIPVTCGTDIFILDPHLPVAGVNRGNGDIVLNPDILDTMPTVLKLFVASRLCAETIVGRDTSIDDCWAVRNGRAAGWFTPKSFALLLRLLRQKPDEGWPPPPGAKRLAAMKTCYASPAVPSGRSAGKGS